MIDTALIMGRRLAESRMTDNCTVTRKTENVFDEETGLYQSSRVIIYSGKCRIREPHTTPTKQEAAAQIGVKQHTQLHLPALAPELKPGDTVDVYPSRNPRIFTLRTDKTYTVLAVRDSSQATAQRADVELIHAK